MDKTQHTLAEDYEHFLAYTCNVPADERLKLAYEHGDYRGRGRPKHKSDCAVHNEPAYPAGPCDCGAEEAPARELVPAAGWLPIETAPKDKYVAVYHPTFANHFWVLSGVEQWGNGFTHWMPLPDAPGDDGQSTEAA